MWPLAIENPGCGTGAKEKVHRQIDCNNYSRFFEKYQAICLLYFLTLLIPESGYFERSLSLAIDRAILQVEAPLWT